MILGAISPKSDKDRRSTLHPNSIKPLKDMGIEIFFERGLGTGIDISDEEMQKNGHCQQVGKIVYHARMLFFHLNLFLLTKLQESKKMP